METNFMAHSQYLFMAFQLMWGIPILFSGAGTGRRFFRFFEESVVPYFLSFLPAGLLFYLLYLVSLQV